MATATNSPFFSSKATLSKQMSVRLYVCLSVRFRGKREFLSPKLRFRSNFFCMSVMLQKSLLLMDVFIPVLDIANMAATTITFLSRKILKKQPSQSAAYLKEGLAFNSRYTLFLSCKAAGIFKKGVCSFSDYSLI